MKLRHEAGDGIPVTHSFLRWDVPVLTLNNNEYQVYKSRPKILVME